jgi:hypothetical protein
MYLDTLVTLIIIAVALGVAGLLGIGAYLVVRDTKRGSGRWGINTQPAKCGRCGEPAPAERKPGSLRQVLWGGWKCGRCGCELDQWGNAPRKDTRDEHQREDRHD